MPDLAADIDEQLRCPTCNAAQVWSDECRRCKSDLRLLRRVVIARRQLRDEALRALRNGHYSEALNNAQLAFDLYPDDPGKRLLATCELLAGNWLRAMLLARDDQSP